MKNFTKTLAFFENKIGEIKGQFVSIHLTTPNGEISKMNTKIIKMIEGQIFVEDYNSPIKLSDVLVLEFNSIIYFHKEDYYLMQVLKSTFEKVLNISQIDLMSSSEPQTFTGLQIEWSLQHFFEISGMKIEDASNVFKKLIQTPYDYLSPVDSNNEVYAIGNGTETQSNLFDNYRIGNKAMWLFDIVDSVNSDFAILNN